MRESRDNAVRRHDRSTAELDELGPIGRRIHRRQRIDIEHRLDTSTRDIARADKVLEELAGAANELVATRPLRRQWERDHQPELDRLQELSHTIADGQLELSIERSKVAEKTFDHGVSL